MKPLRIVSGPACPLGLANVDTDQLIPARFMKRPRSEGYGGFLLHDLRRDEAGAERPDFPLNRAGWREAGILVARRNFGSGSSREAAVYALADHAIRVVLAPTFGDIFASNAVKNGLLPGVLDDADIEDLLAAVQATPDLQVTVDLEALDVRWGNRSAALTVDAVWREQLLNGWDDIDVTRSFAAQIADHAAADDRRRPWARPARS
ncbi:3-isopropylmalate dehydratase small subunit [Bosea sp. BH3]|uniref:3-isopropylmalate dehydratase small subunit n=1 Tax=Bosea sp. BH3 TaxID=2871701 RepID=UPI0021CB801B|nr:3-isopropylmalate dehydratase small subunit [Bosea sp. BH3]MCU4179611.1 3-isopropylmalate dehydratase small subunit [Bosea sp. BH3]